MRHRHSLRSALREARTFKKKFFSVNELLSPYSKIFQLLIKPTQKSNFSTQQKWSTFATNMSALKNIALTKQAALAKYSFSGYRNTSSPFQIREEQLQPFIDHAQHKIFKTNLQDITFRLNFFISLNLFFKIT